MRVDPYDVQAYDYYLPECDIAQEPMVPRDASRLLVLDPGAPPGSPRGMTHARFDDLVGYLRAGDCLVLNRTRVRRARLWGLRLPGGGEAEVLLLAESDGQWRGMIRPARRIRVGTDIQIVSPGEWARLAALAPGDRVKRAPRPGKFLRVTGIEGDGIFAFRAHDDGDGRSLEDLGELPLPPYVTRPPAELSGYQTVYARETGSAAAPTAGLHFTPRILERLRERGIHTPTVVLHVGIGTFRPMRTEDVRAHRMHREWLEVSREAVDTIARARDSGGRVIAVGTTAVRALETAARAGTLRPYQGETDLYIYPGYRFRVVDGLVTNFHLPRSTLLLLVSALAGREQMLAAYREARRRRYRFYSFGDCMYILPGRKDGGQP